LVGLDVSLSKNIPLPRISEAFKAQFRADFFNIINHPNTTSPNDNRAIMDQFGNPFPTAGQITQTNTTFAALQFSVKASW